MSGAATVPARISPTAVFKKRDFVLMWMAQLVSTAGSALTDLAAGIYVYDQTGSAFLVGVTLMATAVPSLIVGLIAGVFVDRWDRRKVMMASNLAQGVVVATIPFLLDIDITLLFVAILVNAGVKQFFDPAYEALIPEIASDEELTAANAFLQIASFGSTAIGFAGAGLLAAIDIRLAFWIDSLTFVFSALCIYFMKTRVKMEAPDEDASVSLVINNLKTGVRTIRDTPMLRSLFLLGAPVFFAFGLWNVLLLPMAITVLGGSEFEYGIQEGLTSIGFVLGSLFMAKYADRLQIGLWVFVGYMGMGIAGILYGLSPTIVIGIVWVMVSGFFNSPSAVARQTLLQRHTPRELRGRVFSALFVMRDVIFLAGMAAAGLADVFDVRVLIILASLILVVTALAALVAPGVGTSGGRVEARPSSTCGPPSPRPPGEVRPATMADFDLLVGRLATFTRLSGPQRAAFVKDALVRDVPEGSRLVTKGDKATAAYFILEGEAAAGIPEEDGGYRGLSTMARRRLLRRDRGPHREPAHGGRGGHRPSTLMEVPADALRGVMEIPEVNKLLLTTLTERLLRSNQPDLPRLVSMDQAALRRPAHKAPVVEALPRAYDAGI